MSHALDPEVARSSTEPTPPVRRSPRRRRVIVLVALGLIVVVAALAVLSLPLAGAPGDARAAKDDLVAAKTALAAGDLAQAKELVASARDHVDAAQGDVGGFGADVLSRVPVVGTAVDDARHLVQALDDATSVAEIGVDLYPSAAGEHATLFRHNQVDEATLERVIAGAHRVDEHLASAQAALGEVQGSTPLVGGTIAARRDEAAAQVDPLADTLDDLAPVLDRLPAVLGFEGERSYLIALLNPAELRYSGGASLSFAPLTFDQGKVEFGKSVQVTDDPTLGVPTSWRKVYRNRFHRPGDHILLSATFAPSWSVSGEELLRAWRATGHAPQDGVFAIDVVALARLLDATGGITVPGYGELTSDNLVHTLIGSYDQYYPDPTVQDVFNKPLIPAFERKFLDGGDYVAKGQALAAAAHERHFALYFRDPDVREGIVAAGLGGDLTEQQGDYLGVFTQNTNGSKVDYYQRRTVSLDVALSADGSARNRVDVAIDNDPPPYAVPGVDPRNWYFTRWAGLALGVFVPAGAEVEHATLLGEPVDLRARRFFSHSFVAQNMLLAPSTTGRFTMRYRVADAATVDDDGELTYRLAVDPQGMVTPESAEVTVHLPEGYAATDLPTGWTADGSTVTLPLQPLSTSQEWEIVAAPRQ